MSIKIGTPLNKQLVKDGWMTYQVTFMLEITTHSKELLRTISNQLLSYEKYSCIGESLAQASQEGPGTKPVWTLTQKILAQNSGMVTEITRMLSSMSSVETSTLHISCDGSTAIQLSWKSRVPQQSLARKRSGSHLIYHPENGSPAATRQRLMR